MPLIVIASAIVRPPLIFNLAPSATVVAPSVAPKPFACVICNLPALTVTAPVKVLFPLNINLALPAFVSIAALSPLLIIPVIAPAPLLVMAKVP